MMCAGWLRHTRLNRYDEVNGRVAAMTKQQGTRELNRADVVLLVIDAEQAFQVVTALHSLHQRSSTKGSTDRIGQKRNSKLKHTKGNA